jgi:hypothetical protein
VKSTTGRPFDSPADPEKIDPHRINYWLGGLGGGGAFMFFGRAETDGVPSLGSGRVNCGFSVLWLSISGMKG